MVKFKVTWKNFKTDKILGNVIAPFLLPLILIIFALIIKMPYLTFLNWINFIGLLILTMGAIFALRPVLRKFLNPNAQKKEVSHRDVNAGVVSFIYIIFGFSMQIIYTFSSLMTWIVGIANWIIITLGVEIVSIILISRTFKKLNKEN